MVAREGTAERAIELRDVQKRYRVGGRMLTALDSVSFSIDEGEFVVVTGRSGSGKSTLLNLIGCLDRPDEGTVTLKGLEVSRAGADELARARNTHVGFVFQQFNLLPQFSALDNVTLPLLYAGVRRQARSEKGMQALAAVGLEDWAEHRPSQLSGGQQQRVAIARALIRQPTVVLADEPTGALDSATAADILELLKSISASGVTLLMVTHDEAVARHANRRLSMLDGRLISDERT